MKLTEYPLRILRDQTIRKTHQIYAGASRACSRARASPRTPHRDRAAVRWWVCGALAEAMAVGIIELWVAKKVRGGAVHPPCTPPPSSPLSDLLADAVTAATDPCVFGGQCVRIPAALSHRPPARPPPPPLREAARGRRVRRRHEVLFKVLLVFMIRLSDWWEITGGACGTHWMPD